MKQFTEQHVNDMIKLRYGDEPDHYDAESHVPYWKLGKIFGCSGQLVRQLILAKFNTDARKNLPLIEQM